MFQKQACILSAKDQQENRTNIMEALDPYQPIQILSV